MRYHYRPGRAFHFKDGTAVFTNKKGDMEFEFGKESLHINYETLRTIVYISEMNRLREVLDYEMNHMISYNPMKMVALEKCITEMRKTYQTIDPNEEPINENSYKIIHLDDEEEYDPGDVYVNGYEQDDDDDDFDDDFDDDY